MASRRDNKGRILNKNEYQRANGMYEYKYVEIDGTNRSVYSWRLNQIDKAPKGKHSEFCLRELIQQIERDKQDGINQYSYDNFVNHSAKVQRKEQTSKIFRSQ